MCKCVLFENVTVIYRVIHVALIFLIWLKMILKIIGDMKAMHFYNHKDPPFDMKHQLMSADPVPVVKIDLNWEANFHYFFHLSQTLKSVCKTFFSNCLNLAFNILSFMACGDCFLGFLVSLLSLLNNFDEIKEIQGKLKNWGFKKFFDKQVSLMP